MPLRTGIHCGALPAHQRIDGVVYKNSGGAASATKLPAAGEGGIAMVMRERPPRPALPTAPNVPAALAWLHGALDMAT
jgi:precorrin-6A/cobalt-precorrin-6A reductase